MFTLPVERICLISVAEHSEGRQIELTRAIPLKIGIWSRENEILEVNFSSRVKLLTLNGWTSKAQYLPTTWTPRMTSSMARHWSKSPKVAIVVRINPGGVLPAESRNLYEVKCPSVNPPEIARKEPLQEELMKFKWLELTNVQNIWGTPADMYWNIRSGVTGGPIDGSVSTLRMSYKWPLDTSREQSN